MNETLLCDEIEFLTAEVDALASSQLSKQILVEIP